MKRTLTLFLAALCAASAIAGTASAAFIPGQKTAVKTTTKAVETQKAEEAPKAAETQKAAEAPKAAEAVEEKNPYAAPAKTAEVYDAKAKNRPLKVLGASVSDGNWCVLFGECAVGTTVTVKNTKGTYSVVSEGGCFALRFLNPDTKKADLTVTQSAGGKQIGNAIQWKGNIVTPKYGMDWGVWIGKENQGFYKKMIPDFTHVNRMDDATAKKVQDRYAERVKKLKEVDDGCEMIMVLAPSSMTVYPELVPEEVAKPGEGESLFDQLKTVLTNAGVTVIDMRETFAERKNDSLPLYFNYDSHWTDYGSYLAYVDLYKHISEKFPKAAPRTFDEFTWDWGYYTRGDMPWYFELDQGGKIYEHTFIRRMNFEPIKQVKDIKRFNQPVTSLAFAGLSQEVKAGKNYKTNRAELPDIMVMRNSYGAYMYDLMVERSDSSYMLASFSQAFNIAQIKKNAPDYLIYVLSEWDFGMIINN